MVRTTEQNLCDEDSVEHCAENMWERFVTQVGAVWRLRLKHGVLDQHERRCVQPHCVPMTLSKIGHQHTLTFTRDMVCADHLNKCVITL